MGWRYETYKYFVDREADIAFLSQIEERIRRGEFSKEFVAFFDRASKDGFADIPDTLSRSERSVAYDVLDSLD